MDELNKRERGRPLKNGPTKREAAHLAAVKRREERAQQKQLHLSTRKTKSNLSSKTYLKRPEDRTYHYTYKVTCINMNRIFYGLHSSDDLEDGFIGASNAIWQSKNEHGIENHFFERLHCHPTRKDAKVELANLKATQLVNPRKPGEHAFHFVYKTIRNDGKYYIGVHSTNNLNDSYMGSGTYIGRSLKKHGKSAHTREILEMCESRDSAFEREKEIVTPELLIDPLCMNGELGGRGSTERVYGFTEETLMKISTNSLQMWAERKAGGWVSSPQKPEHIAKRTIANTGKKRTKEQKLNLNAGRQKYYENADPLILQERGKKSANTRKERGTNLGGRPSGIAMKEEQKQHQREMMKGDTRLSVRASCIHCKKETTAVAIKQFHKKCQDPV